ncbi:hypothetical protein JCM10207_003918 [Rhodosporidiobolus poonsookiae]
MSATADPRHMPDIYARQEQDEKLNEKNGQVSTRPLGGDEEAGGALRPVVADAFALQEGDEEHLNYKTMGWAKAGMIITCEAIALGTLSFPSTFHRLGMAGGIICNTVFVAVAYLTAWLYVDFKLKYPYVMNAADAGEVMFGKWGARIVGVGIVAKSIGLASSHILAGKIAISTFDSGAHCSIGWAVLIAGVSCLLSYQRQWSGLTYMSIASITCIIVACIITMVGAATQDPARLIKNGVPISWRAFNSDLTLTDCIGAITNTIFAYGQNMACLSFMPEMKRPEDFKKSIFMMQTFQLVIYTIVGAVVYSYTGQYVTSPALTVTAPTLRITAYGFALVTIIVSGIVAVNVGAKYFYVSLFRNTPILTSKSWKAQSYWLAILAAIWVFAFVIAELIPFFNQLLTIVSCLTSTWFVCGFAAMCGLHNRNPRLPENANNGGWFASPGRILMVVICVLLICFSAAITPLGLYSAITGIIDGYSKGSFHHPFACST